MITILEQIDMSRPDKLQRRREFQGNPIRRIWEADRSWPDLGRDSLVSRDWDSYQNEHE
jgi:hypothetical protein